MAIRTKATLVKYLVLDSLSTINKREIKRLTGSAIAEDLKFSQRDYYNWPSTLHHSLLRAFATRDNGRYHREFKIFELDDNAVSMMYALRDEHFVAALSLSDDLVSRLDNLLSIKNDIEHLNGLLDGLIDSRCEGIKKRLGIVGITLKGFGTFEQAIANVKKNIPKAEYDDVVNEISEIIKPSW